TTLPCVRCTTKTRRPSRATTPACSGISPTTAARKRSRASTSWPLESTSARCSTRTASRIARTTTSSSPARWESPLIWAGPAWLAHRVAAAMEHAEAMKERHPPRRQHAWLLSLGLMLAGLAPLTAADDDLGKVAPEVLGKEQRREAVGMIERDI